MRVWCLAVATTVALLGPARADGPPKSPAPASTDDGGAPAATQAGAPAAVTAPAPGSAAAPMPATAPDAGSAGAPSPTPVPPSAAAAVTVAPPPRVLPPIPAGMGRIAGKVTLAGLAPKMPPVPVGKDMKTCGTSKADEALEVGPGGGVKNALLWAPGGPPPAKGSKVRAKLSLLACQFTPHVVAAPAGSELLVINEDAVFHNATASGDLAFSYAMPIKGHSVPTKLKKPGVVKVESKSHPWMRAWVHVLPTVASVVTEADGTWYLDLPPGAHQVKLWHERLGEREDKLEVEAGKTVVHDMALTPR